MSQTIMMMVCGFWVGVVCSYLVYMFTSGSHDTLSEAKVGHIYHFNYQQPLNGEKQRYMAKVLDIHRLSEDSIRRLNKQSQYRKNDVQFHRTTHLVTAQTPDGKIRNFYAERTSNVRRPLLGKVLYRMAFAGFMMGWCLIWPFSLM